MQFVQGLARGKEFFFIRTSGIGLGMSNSKNISKNINKAEILRKISEIKKTPRLSVNAKCSFEKKGVNNSRLLSVPEMPRECQDCRVLS